MGLSAQPGCIVHRTSHPDPTASLPSACPLLQVDPSPGQPATCVAVRFDRFTVEAGPLPRTELSLAWLRPLGYVATIYLDSDTRVSVGDKGGLFVLRRAAGEGEVEGRAAGSAA